MLSAAGRCGPFRQGLVGGRRGFGTAMSDVETSYRLWIPGNHRHHNSFAAGNEVPGTAAVRALETTYVGPVVAPDPIDVDRFQFWSASGSTDAGAYLLSHEGAAAYPSGGAPGTLTAWYLGGSGPGNDPGLIFDAFSLAAGDFLDWGDGFDPFTVTPGSSRRDNLAETADDAVTVTAASVWPGPGPLVFDSWLVFGLPALPGVTVDASRGQSATCVALYASPLGPPDPTRRRWPPDILVLGDPAQFTREIVQSLAVDESVRQLGDPAVVAAVRTLVLQHIAEQVQTELKKINTKAPDAPK
jgi:hypothetical protein